MRRACAKSNCNACSIPNCMGSVSNLLTLLSRRIRRSAAESPIGNFQNLTSLTKKIKINRKTWKMANRLVVEWIERLLLTW